MSVLLALAAALSYGLADFVGGVTSQRVSAWSVAFVAQVGGGVTVLAAAVMFPGDPTATDLAWAVAAGVANGCGTAFLYRGLASGRMGVVAPVSGVGAALVPVIAGVALGERPTLLVWVGIAAAVPGIWLVSRETASSDAPRTGSTGLLDGVLAGLGFGFLFVALARIDEDAGLLPLALNQVIAMFAVVLVAIMLRGDWVPRDPRAGFGLVSGVLGVLATLGFMLASQIGYLSVTAVITALYPAFTVVLAATVLRERIHRGQAGGLVLCAVAVAMVALG